MNTSDKQSLYTLYSQLLIEYREKYGEKTVVFLQVGSFYELYATQDPISGHIDSDIKEISDSLGLQVAILKGQGVNGKDGIFSGFPDYSLHRWASKLTSQGWTVVIVDQVKSSSGKVQKRTLSRVLSPSTHVEAVAPSETPYLSTIYFNATSTAVAPSYGIATLDLTTGLTISFSDKASGRPDFWTADTLVQNLSIFQPKEVLIYWHSTATAAQSHPPPASLRTILGLPEHTTIHLRPISTIGSFSKTLSNAEYLRKAYSIKSLLPPKEYLNIRSDQEELSIMFLLQFIEEHMPSISQRLSHNEPWIPNQQLVCGNHALSQLQIISSQPNGHCVTNLFSGAITPMGKRGLPLRLTRPLTSPKTIEQRLSEIDHILSWSQEQKQNIQKHLRFCFDLPRLHRKVHTGTLQLTEYSSLHQTYSAITNIIPSLDSSPLQPLFNKCSWQSYLTLFNTHISSEKAFSAVSSQDISPFSNTTYPIIQNAEKEIQDTLTAMMTLTNSLAKAAGLAQDALRLEPREKGEAFGIRGSATQIKALQKSLSSLPQGTHISALKSGGWVDTPQLVALNHKLLTQREELSRLSQEAHLSVCQLLSTAEEGILSQVEQWVTHLDVSQAIANTCQAKGFHRPQIIQDCATSYVDLEGLRHPLVEASSTSRVSYVQHSVSLGKDPSSNGYLIYGMNASGKSTLMKATGVAVLLAQAGCYVPATRCEIAPFRAIYTRILNHDNLFAGLSSFAVEMSELRDILSSADHQTLVLGDELCAGTESVSAEALVAAGIQWLSNQEAKFMFATHLHRLSDLLQSSTTELGLKIYHLHVDYDPVSKKLIYDRSLRPGSGTSLYGLEVARAMDLPLEFIEQANKNRHRLLGSVTQMEANSSTWNSSIVRRSCELCNSHITKDLEVHHIEQRSLANEKGILPNGKPMNDPSNLVVLCQLCHDKHHANQLLIHPLVQTSEGPERLSLADLDAYVYSGKKPTPSSPPSSPQTEAKSKWTKEEQEHIRKMLTQFKTMSLKVIQFQLKQQYSIDISVQTLGKMRKEI
jgi:DNA mismatch repair protein MutS